MLQNSNEDERLNNAVKVSMETQEITPLIKEELRLSIIKKRHASGQDEIKVEFPEPKQYELTETEKRKRERRREQNRRAAQRCRQKKKLMQNGKQEVFSTVVEANTKLQEEVKKLRREKKYLCECLQEHIQSGCCRQTNTKSEVALVHPLPVVNPPSALEFYPTYPECPTSPPQPTVPTALPSFADAFETSPFLDNDGFQFPDMRNEIHSNRTWSGTSDDVIPPESLPETIFDALDQSDDVFYENETSPVKMSCLDVNFAIVPDPINNNEMTNWAQQDMFSALEPDPGHLNEP